jgi:protocatechuate 3,4-dioxygenase, beta subunit
VENANPLISRRQFTVAGALAASAAVAASRAHAAVGLLPTPGQILGPFWPTQAVPDMSGDLTHVPGRTGRAVGQLLHVTGRVLNRDGIPVANAKLDIWQANAAGRYRHPSDTNPAPLDPNFNGFAELTTDTDGNYRFITIKPGSYPAGPNIIRPAHIHFDVTGRVNRIVTQMYFDGDPYNASDRWLQSALRPEALIVTPKSPTADFEPDSRMVTFDIVLIDG